MLTLGNLDIPGSIITFYNCKRNFKISRRFNLKISDPWKIICAKLKCYILEEGLNSDALTTIRKKDEKSILKYFLHVTTWQNLKTTFFIAIDFVKNMAIFLSI